MFVHLSVGCEWIKVLYFDYLETRKDFLYSILETTVYEYSPRLLNILLFIVSKIYLRFILIRTADLMKPQQVFTLGYV